MKTYAGLVLAAIIWISMLLVSDFHPVAVCAGLLAVVLLPDRSVRHAH